MGDLFGLLRKRIHQNSLRAVDTCVRELAEYRLVASQPQSYAAMVEFQAFTRRRMVDLAPDGRPLTGDDLAVVAAAGRQHGRNGHAVSSLRRSLVLHTTVLIHEIEEAAGPNDVEELLGLLGWVGQQGTAAREAFLRGYADGLTRFLSVVKRVQMLAAMLLAEDTLATDLAQRLGMRLPERYVVTVVRIADPPTARRDEWREDVVEDLLQHCWAPITWHRPDEMVALVPDGGSDTEERVLAAVHEFARLVDRPCSVGTAVGDAYGLADALVTARQVSEVAPLEPLPRRPYNVSDVFVELGVARLPHVDMWLRDVAGRLSGGPDLVTTLDAYYRHDLNRVRTAASLRIHPRTLDYRLQRARDLGGVDPSSPHGIRILTAVVARVLAGAWT